MPELREVFQMVRNQTEPIRGAWEEQERRQRRVTRNRKIGAISLATALAVVTAWFVLSGSDVTDRGKETNKVAGRPAALPSEPGVYLFDLETGEATHVAGIVPPGFESPGIAVSPDGTMVAYRGTDPEGNRVIYVANVDGTNIRPLEKTSATAPDTVGPQFSPDGSQIAYQAKDDGTWTGDIFLVDIATGETTRLTRLKPVAGGLWYMGPTFSPDGETVFFTRPSGNFVNQSWNLWSVPTSGGKPTLVLRDAIGGRPSPDGRKIVYFKPRPSPENSFLGDMWLAQADGTDARRVARGDVFSARWSPDGTRIAFTEQGRGGAYVIDVTTGEISRVLKDTDEFPEWVDDHTWIIGVD
jgi:Tol biopolymer transport system component